MSKPVPLPKFAVGTVVILLADLEILEGIDEDIEMARTQVLESHYSETAGWIYQIRGVAGYQPERLLQRDDNQDELGPITRGGVRSIITAEEIDAILEEEPVEINTYVRMTDFMAQGHDDKIHHQYGLITGKQIFAGDVDYTIAMLSAEGNFLEDPATIFNSDEFEIVDELEIANARRISKPKPVLALVR